MEDAPDSATRRRWPAILGSAVYVLLMIAVAVIWGGVLLWVRLAAAGVALLIGIAAAVVGRKEPTPPRPAGSAWMHIRAEWRNNSAHWFSWVLASLLGAMWEGDPVLLVLAGVLGSIPFLALNWWKALHRKRPTPRNCRGSRSTRLPAN
jgi:hypothetical protein